ncbi:MAG TPA: FtsX-like permease family protein [Acidimicrobiales bacterium]|nr:FtsX-like permease family protein [Acidimicrobiales bacterium]
MLRTTLKSIGAHKRRLLSTCTAVLFGVAFLSGTLVLGATMRDGFANAFEEANAGTDTVVRSATEVGEGDFTERGRLEASLVDHVAAVDGVATAVPVVEGTGQIVGSDGDPIGGNGPPTMAGGWITDSDLNPWDIDEGRAPEAPGEVVIDKASAEDGDLAVGDATTIRTPEPVDATVVGLATFGDADSMGGPTYAAFTTAYAQQVLLPDPGQISKVLVAGDGSLTEDQLAARLAEDLPDGVETLTGAELTREQRDAIESDFLGFLENFLLVFAGIALVVATFSIYNTFSILVAQRTRESALLRALGASRRQVVTSVVVEALLVGVIASALGIAAGVGLAVGLLALAEASFGLMSTPLVVGATPIVAGLAVGVIVTLVASIAPAVKASRVAPLAALRDVAIDTSGSSRIRAGFGALATLGGGTLTIVGTAGDGSIALAGIGALVTLVGVVLLGPVVARPAAAVLGSPLTARRRMAGKLARQNAMRNPRRTAGTASALMVGVAVVTLFTVVGASIKQSIDDTVSEQFAGDLVMVTTDFSGSGMSPELANTIGELPEVDTAVGIANAPVRVGDTDYAASAVDPRQLGALLDLGTTAGSFDDIGADQIALQDDWAADRGYTVGEPVPVTFADGVTEQLVLGVTYDSEQLMGDVIVPRAAWAPHAGQPTDMVVAIALADGVSTADGEAAIQPIADRFGGPDVQDRGEYVDSVAGQVDQLLIIVYVLLLLAIVIALMGIANTLSLSIHERTRELGLLRAVGQSRRQVRAMVRGEAAVVSLFGTVGGVALGSFLGWALVMALADEDLGAFALPVGQLGVVLALGALVGVVAALRPARRASRLDVLQAIATE